MTEPLYPADALIEGVTPDALTALAAVSDPLDRQRAAVEAIEAAVELRGRMVEVRRDAVRELRGSGRPPLRTWAEVGTLLGTTGARAQQIADMPADRSAPRGPRTSPPPFAPELANAPRHPMEPE